MEAHSLLDNNRQQTGRKENESKLKQCISRMHVKSLDKLVRFCQGRVLYETEDSGFHSLCTTATTSFIWHLEKPIQTSRIQFGSLWENIQ